MPIRIREADQEEELTYPDSAAVLSAIDAGEVTGNHQYYAPGSSAWVPIDFHPVFSTSDARGIYPAIVHLVVFIKIFVFIAFLSILDGNWDALLHPGAIYVYIVLAGDTLGLVLAYTNRNRLSAVFLWILGVATMPLGLYLIVAANMTRNFRYQPAEA